MSLREKLNNNPQIATGAAVVVLLLCLLLIYCQFAGPGGTRTKLLYFDLDTNAVKLVDYKTGDSIESPLPGTQTYQVSIFSCEECKEITDGMTAEQLQAQGMFAAYVYRTAAGAAAVDEFMSTEVRAIGGPDTWVSIDSEAGGRLTQQAQSRCPGGRPTPCTQKPRDD